MGSQEQGASVRPWADGEPGRFLRCSGAAEPAPRPPCITVLPGITVGLPPSSRAPATAGAVVQLSANGIRPEAEPIGRIFDPFLEAKAVGVSTGLGLSISHNSVTQLGGEIVVESTPGHGTTVRVVLPAAAAAKDAVEVAINSQPSPLRERARLLIIDDEPSLALTLKYLLQDRHEVTTCTSGAEALALLRGPADYDAILCDLMMPGITGMDVHALLAKERPGLEERIVFMTGGAFTPRATNFLATSDNPRLEKPFTADDVDVALHAIAEGRPMIPH